MALLDSLFLVRMDTQVGWREPCLLELVFLGLLVFAGFGGLSVELFCCELYNRPLVSVRMHTDDIHKVSAAWKAASHPASQHVS